MFWLKFSQVCLFEQYNINETWSLSLKFLKYELAFSRSSKSSDLWVEQKWQWKRKCLVVSTSALHAHIRFIVSLYQMYIQNKLACKVFFYFKLFMCPPDVKMPNFSGALPLEPPTGLCHEPTAELIAHSDPHLHFTIIFWLFFMKQNIQKLRIFVQNQTLAKLVG